MLFLFNKGILDHFFIAKQGRFYTFFKNGGL